VGYNRIPRRIEYYLSSLLDGVEEDCTKKQAIMNLGFFGSHLAIWGVSMFSGGLVGWAIGRVIFG